MTAAMERGVRRLSAASSRKVIEPDVSVAGEVGDGQVLADELLSVVGLPLAADLTAEQRRRLSREEVAAIAEEGIRFEAALLAGFGLEISRAADLTDPRVTYLLHELGEETRHSRLFVRLIGQLAPTARNPFNKGALGAVKRVVVRSIMGKPALLCVLVLAGEEIPDLLQKLSAEHPDTDPFLRDVNRYHRHEEARHLAFARMVLPELWAKASWWERFRVRYQAPLLIENMFDMLVHPGVYAAIGLPGWATWWAVKQTPERLALRHLATRPVAEAMVAAGVLPGRRLPWAWRRLVGASSVLAEVDE